VKPRIIQAADAVAYLPLYVAERGGVALELGHGRELTWNDAFGEPSRSPPIEYLEAISTGPGRSGDQGCLNAVAGAWESKRVPLIGFCDPCNITAHHADKLVIVGGFIRRACFWCLTDNNVDAAKPEDLTVTDLFIHGSGFETGHKIGEKILGLLRRRANPPDVVEGSFELLIDGAVWYKKANPSRHIAAVSASILSCVIAEEEHGFKVAFPLNKLAEYREFLTTGIVVHREALQDQEMRVALKLLLRSLMWCQKHIAVMNHAVEELLILANEQGRFSHERRINSARVEGLAVVPNGEAAESPLQNITRSQATAVWRALCRDSIYDPTCDISANQWENAWKLRGDEPPPLDRYFDRTILDEAQLARLVGEPDEVQHVTPPAAQAPWLAILLSVLLMAGLFLRVSGIAILLGLLGASALSALLFREVLRRNASWLDRARKPALKFISILVVIAAGGLLLIAIAAGLAKAGDGVEALPAGFPLWLNSLWETWAPRIREVWHPVWIMLSPFVGGATVVLLSRRRGQSQPSGSQGGDRNESRP
jgi:hypothetical protein